MVTRLNPRNRGKRAGSRRAAAGKKAASVSEAALKRLPHVKSQSRAALSSNEMIEAIRRGLPIRELDALQNSLGVPMERLAPKLGMSKATLHRRKLQGRLGPEESDRVFRYARLMGKAVLVLESQESARRWMAAPQVGLGGAVPLDYAETEVGAREVEDLLGRIEFGVYS